MQKVPVGDSDEEESTSGLSSQTSSVLKATAIPFGLIYLITAGIILFVFVFTRDYPFTRTTTLITTLLDMSIAGTLWSTMVGAVNGLMSAIVMSPSYTQMVYVNLNGSDTTGTGSIIKPFRTINHALSTITDAVTTKRYSVEIASGLFAETGDIALVPYVYLRGSGMDVTTVTSSTNLVSLGSLFNVNGTYRFGVESLSFVGSTNVTFDTQALTTYGGITLEMTKVGLTNALLYKGRTMSDVIEMKQCVLSSVVGLHACESSLVGNVFKSSLTVSDSASASSTIGSTTYISGGRVFGALIFEKTMDLLWSAELALVGTIRTGSLLIATNAVGGSNGLMLIYADAGSIPPTRYINEANTTLDVKAYNGQFQTKIGTTTLSVNGSSLVLDAFATAASVIIVTPQPGQYPTGVVMPTLKLEGSFWIASTMNATDNGVVVGYQISKAA